MKNQQTTRYPIQGLIIGCIFGYAFIALAWGGERALSPVRGALRVDRDTIQGTPPNYYEMNPWPLQYRIVIKNNSDQGVVLDTALLRLDSAVTGGLLSMAFSVRSHSYPQHYVTIAIRTQNPLVKFPAFAIPAHDSVEIGNFLIGPDHYLPKKTATSTSSEKFQDGDSISTPVVLFAGKDSVKFIVQAVVQHFLSGDEILKKPMVRLRPTSRSSFQIDGRRLPESVPNAARKGLNTSAGRGKE